jgi:hypothetical protein
MLSKKKRVMVTEEKYHKALLLRYPFWETLSPTTVKRRLEQILALPNSAVLIQALSPVEYTLLLKEAAEMRPVLLELAHPEQIRTVLDLDCWDKDTLRSTRVLEWLEELQRSGEEVSRHALEVLDREMLILALQRHIKVHAVLPLEEEVEPRLYDEVLDNELYRIEFVTTDSLWNERIVRILQMLRLIDLDYYHSLMQGVMREQESALETWAYRWKSGRLQDEGFPEYYEALETYSLVDLKQLLPASFMPLQTPGLPESAAVSGQVPSYVWSLTPANSPLDTAIASHLSVATQERLCGEMIYLCNRALVVDQVDFADAVAVRTSLARVHATLNIGLAYLWEQQRQPLPVLLTTYALQTIYQIGFTLSMRLHQRALRIQTHLNGDAGLRRALPGLTRQVLDGLLDRPPQFFAGVAQPGESEYRDFSSIQDITLVTPILTALEDDPLYHFLDHPG